MCVCVCVCVCVCRDNSGLALDRLTASASDVTNEPRTLELNRGCFKPLAVLAR